METNLRMFFESVNSVKPKVAERAMDPAIWSGAGITIFAKCSCGLGRLLDQYRRYAGYADFGAR